MESYIHTLVRSSRIGKLIYDEKKSGGCLCGRWGGDGRELTGRGRRNLYEGKVIRCILMGIGFGCVHLSGCIQWFIQDLCISLCRNCISKIVSKYWILVNDMHTEVFRGELHPRLQLTLKQIMKVRWTDKWSRG